MDPSQPLFVFVEVNDEGLVEDEMQIEDMPITIAKDRPAQCNPKPAEEPTRKKRRRKKLKFTHQKKRSQSARLSKKKKELSDLLIFKDIDSENTTDSSAKLSSNRKELSELLVFNNANSQDTLDSTGSEQVEASKTDYVSHSNHSDLQITSVVSKADYFFNFENNNDSHPTGEQCEVLDPLENHCDTKNDGEDINCDIENMSISNLKKDFKNQEVDIKILTPYIKKLCANCEKVTELVQNNINSTANKICHLCEKPVAYCCKFCLEISGLKEIYIHIYKNHYLDATANIVTPAAEEFLCSKCGEQYENSITLKLHEQFCDVRYSLFCRFCSAKTRTKREMREHISSTHHTAVHRYKPDAVEQMLDEIVVEADKIMGMWREHYGYCRRCKKEVPLTQRPINCFACSAKLIYHCNDRGCIQRVYAEMISFETHLRYHANEGYTFEPPKIRKNPNNRLCHLCGYEGSCSKYKKHMSRKHPDIIRCKCDWCGKILKNVQMWKRHQRSYCPVTHKKLRCEHCWFRCFRKTRMRRHLKTVHTHLYTGKRPRCDKCGITWAGLYRLRLHSSECSGDFKVERARQKEIWALRGVVTLS